MDARTILDSIRGGAQPGPDALRWAAKAIADGQMTDAQVGAFSMGICRNGLNDAGRVALTLAMRDTGTTLDWDLPGPVVDKHSTGGVGDCVSLILAPALAACGLYCPMISGRGLGHTGGTLDKLEAIPGLRTDLSIEDLRKVTKSVGCAIASASGNIAPADKRLYAIRDVTGTVASRDLIVPSILSKKLAGGAEGLVFDVKTGSGAFMTSLDEATALAEALVSTAQGAGVAASALITDMNQPLARALGNALEITETVAVLRGEKAGRLLDVTIELGAACLDAAGIDRGAERLTRAIAEGQALERFRQMIVAQGGDPDAALPVAPVMRPVPSPCSGHVAGIDGIAVGMAVVRLGGGRMRDGDRIDPSVGLSDMVELGTAIEAGAPLAVVHAADESSADIAEAAVVEAIAIGGAGPQPPLIHRRIG